MHPMLTLEQKREQVQVLLRQAFRPEFLNRLDDIVMFQALSQDDLAQIVEDQGHDIATIEVNVTSAEAHTEEGVGHLTQAEKYQKGYRKWIIAVLLIIILAAASVGAWYGVNALKAKK